MGLNNEQFVERYEMLMEGAGIQELEKILQVRGAKKTDFPQLVKSIESKMWYSIARYYLFYFCIVFFSKDKQKDKIENYQL